MCARLISASTDNAHAILLPRYDTGWDGDVHRSRAQARSFAAKSSDGIRIASFAIAIVTFRQSYQADDIARYHLKGHLLNWTLQQPTVTSSLHTGANLLISL